MILNFHVYIGRFKKKNHCIRNGEKEFLMMSFRRYRCVTCFGNLLKCIHTNISNKYRKILTNGYRLYTLCWLWCLKIEGHTLKVDIAARCPSSIVESKYGDTGILHFSNCKKPRAVLLPLYGTQEQPREFVKADY